MAVTVAIIFSSVLLPIYVLHSAYSCAPFALWQFRHGRRGRQWLAVYSDGQKWKDHFERTVLPIVEPAVVVVNISRDPEWSRSGRLERRVHRVWGGRTEFSPVLIRFPRLLGRVQVVRLHQAYLQSAKRLDCSSLESRLSQVRALVHGA